MLIDKVYVLNIYDLFEKYWTNNSSLLCQAYREINSLLTTVQNLGIIAMNDFDK